MEMFGLLRIIMVLGSAFMILLIMNSWDDVGVTQRLHAKLHDRQEQRRLLLKEMCSSDGLVYPGKNRSFDDIPDEELNNFLVDDVHGIIYCFVPKVACTNWKRVMIVLSGIALQDGVPYKDSMDIPIELVHNKSMYFTFNQFGQRYGEFSRQFMELKLKRYTKFLFVRDPFVRLLSAYRNKFEKLNEGFYHRYAQHLLWRYANKTSPASADDAFAMGIRPSFAHFIQYLLDPQTEKDRPFDVHWRQMYRLCHPCQIQYDFVGHMESVEEDAEQLLRQLRVDGVVEFPMSNHVGNITNSTWLVDWFSTVPLAARRELYKLYETDFRLFGYDRPDSILNE